MTLKPETQEGLCQLDLLPPAELRAFAKRYGTCADPVVRNLAAYALARANWRVALDIGDLQHARLWASVADERYFELPLEYRW